MYNTNLNINFRYGWTCLHYAASEGNKTMVEMLIGYGADVTTRDKDGTSPAFRAHVSKLIFSKHFFQLKTVFSDELTESNYS